MIIRICLFLFTSLFLISCQESEEIPISIEKGFKKIETNNIEFYWKVEKDQLIGKIVVETEGWVGIGFNPIDKMQGAVMVLGFIKKDLPGFVEEHYGDTIQTHKPVEELGRKKTLVSGDISRLGKNMVMNFIIPISTILENQEGDKTRVILAYGKTHRLSSYHALNRTSVLIKLF